jgi:hypothetical protein
MRDCVKNELWDTLFEKGQDFNKHMKENVHTEILHKDIALTEVKS